jgi:4-hydroxybenzoate polyprenyltransferase
VSATLAAREPGLLRALLGSSRPLSWVNTAYPFATAYLLAGGGVDAALLVGTVYFLVPYNLLMYGINDVFDYESDLRNARKGGVEGVVLSSRWHRATIVAAFASNVPFLAALLWWGSAWSAAVLAVVVFAVVAYSAPGLRFKERPVLDSITSSTHFAGPAVFGLVLADGAVDTVAVCALTAFFLWGMASQAFGAVQDIGADREAGIGSIGTVLGAAATVRVALGLYVAAGVVALGAGWPGALAALLVVPYASNVARFRSLADHEAELAHAGWQRFLWLNYVAGFLLTQLFIWIAW